MAESDPIPRRTVFLVALILVVLLLLVVATLTVVGSLGDSGAMEPALSDIPAAQ